jgi:hypothetical protein
MRLPPTHREPMAFVLGVLAVLAAVVLATPSGATQAKWADQQAAAAPAMSLGRIGLGVVPAGSTATLTNTSDFGVGYRPVQVSLLDRSGRPMSPPSGMTFEYRTGTGCTTAGVPARWATTSGGQGPVAVGDPAAPLRRGGSTGICLAVSTNAAAEEALRPLDGQRLQVVTTVEAVPAGGGSWADRRTWAMDYVVDAPPAQVTGKVVPGTCTASGDAVGLKWDWTGTAAVDRWEIWIRSLDGTETPAIVDLPAAARSVQLTVDRFPKTAAGARSYDVVVRAFPAGSSASVDSAPVRGFKVPGNSNKVQCE